MLERCQSEIRRVLVPRDVVDERGVSFRFKDYRRNGQARYGTMQSSTTPSSTAAAASPQSSAAFSSQSSPENHSPPEPLPRQIPIDGQALTASRAFVLRRLSDAGPYSGSLARAGPASETLHDCGHSRDRGRAARFNPFRAFDPVRKSRSSRRPRIHSSDIPALRRPAKTVVSYNARTFGTPQYPPTALTRAMLDQRSSPTSLRASASSAAARLLSPLRA